MGTMGTMDTMATGFLISSKAFAPFVGFVSFV